MSDVMGRAHPSPRRPMFRLPMRVDAAGFGGQLLFAVPCLLAAALALATYAPRGVEAGIGMAVGAAVVVAMAQTQTLAARPRLLEPMFDGVDRMCRVHEWLGISALALMILHDQFEPNFERRGRETRLGALASDAGEVVFNALLVLIAISWFRRLPFIGLEIPYHLWRFTHRFMGAPFAIVVFHQAFVDLPAGVDPSLSVLLNTFGLAGLIAWVHTEVIAPRLRLRAYLVSRISLQGIPPR